MIHPPLPVSRTICSNVLAVFIICLYRVLHNCNMMLRKGNACHTPKALNMLSAITKALKRKWTYKNAQRFILSGVWRIFSDCKCVNMFFICLNRFRFHRGSVTLDHDMISFAALFKRRPQRSILFTRRHCLRQ